ncbi:DUF5723 family protein [Gracilimonas tropica]|uniref:DUF5723 family protein n=1 Tax=Gracilimonas tropica TaxID=454600 RepID=UPI001FDF57FC|nr:DUF5723 family protein [Gracilimonas tropica]
MKKNLLLLLLIFGVTSVTAYSQSRHYTSQSIAMGSGGTAYMSGFNANFVNPANLMLEMHRANVEVGLLNFGLKTGGDLANVAVYNKYLTTGQLIAGDTRTNMLAEWFGDNPENTRNLSTTFSMSPVGVSYRGTKQAFSVASRMRITEDFTINKGMAELLTYGLDSDKFSTRTPINFGSNTIAFAEVSFGYARELDFIPIPKLPFVDDVKIFAGVAPKYLHGIYTANLQFNSFLTMNDPQYGSQYNITHEFNYNLQTIGVLSRQLQEFEAAYNQNSDAELGDYVDAGDLGDDLAGAQATGFGLDFGLTAELDISSLPVPLFMKKDKKLRVSMSFTDLGSLNFNKDASDVYADGTFTYEGIGEDETVDSYFDNLSDSLQNDVYGQFNSQGISGIEYSLPSMFNFGTSLEIGNLLVAIDYGVGFNTNGLNSDRSTLSLGAQYKVLGFIPLRVGTRVGGYSSTTYSAGIGLDFNNFELTVGASSVSNSEKRGASIGAAWSGLVIRF